MRKHQHWRVIFVFEGLLLLYKTNPLNVLKLWKGQILETSVHVYITACGITFYNVNVLFHEVDSMLNTYHHNDRHHCPSGNYYVFIARRKSHEHHYRRWASLSSLSAPIVLEGMDGDILMMNEVITIELLKRVELHPNTELTTRKI